MVEKNQSISLVFPMYNEREYLPLAVKTAQSVLDKISRDYEIIVVDDASTDGSGEIADELSKRNVRVRVIHHQRNRKLGGALKTGFFNATKDIIIYTDIDLPYDLSVLQEALPLISAFDIIRGCRKGRRESTLRWVYSRVYNVLINSVFSLKARDVNFALKIFKREMLHEIELKSEGSFINAELLAKAKKLGYSIKEIPVEYHLRTYGVSRLSTPAVILKILYEMLKFYPEIMLLSRKRVTRARLRQLYQQHAASVKAYNFIRMNTCPFEVIEDYIPLDGTVVDLGCGTGIFLNLLSLRGNNRLLVGVDKDERKISVALKSGAGRVNIRFERKDICDHDLALAGSPHCITLIDVLCYLDLARKKEVLEKCFKMLGKNGSLIIKDIERVSSIKFLWTFIQELLAIKIFHVTLAKRLHFEDRTFFVTLLQRIGFTVETHDISKSYCYPHILYVCKK